MANQPPRRTALSVPAMLRALCIAPVLGVLWVSVFRVLGWV